MIISLINTISSLTRKGVSVVRENLQMWLGFNKSEVIGSELVVNGDFAELPLGTGWDNYTSGSSSITFTEGAILSIDGSNSNVGVYQQNIFTSGVQYKIIVNIKATANFDAEIVESQAAVTQTTIGNVSLTTSYQNFTFYFTASGTNDLFIHRLYGESAGQNQQIYIKDVAVKEVTQFAKDKSTNTNNAKLFTGKALSFDGANDYVDHGAINPQSGVWSFLATIKSSDTTTASVISNPIFTRNNYYVVFGVNSGKLAAAYYNGGWVTQTFSDDIVSNDSYNRISYEYDVTNETCKGYLNGVLLSSITFNPESILDFNRIGSASADKLNGVLSNLQIWQADLTDSDYLFDYNNPNHLAIDNPDTDLVVADLKGYWAMSEGDGLVAYDSSGEGNNGTINGATYTPAQDTIPQLGMMDWVKSTPVADEVTLIQAPNNKGYDILGNALRLREHAFNLDGSGYAEIADDDSLDFGTGDFTLEAWVKYGFIHTGSGWNCILGLGGIVDGTTSSYISSRDGAFRFQIGTTYIDSTPTLNIGEWYHIVGVREGSEMRFYIDKSQEVITQTSSQTVTNSFVKNIGSDNGSSRRYKDLIDEPRIYNRALTQKEITQNYKAGINKHKASSSFSDDFSSDYGI